MRVRVRFLTPEIRVKIMTTKLTTAKRNTLNDIRRTCRCSQSLGIKLFAAALQSSVVRSEILRQVGYWIREE